MKKLFATSLALILAVSFFVWHRTLPEPAGRPLPVASSAKPEVPAIHREKPQQALKSKAPEKRVPPARKQEIAAQAAPVIIRINAASLDEMKLGTIQKRKERLALVSADHEGVRLDLGGDLPWPIPKSPLFQDNRDIGFHVGLNYRLDGRWDVTGLAGANLDAGNYPLKPNMEQIGVRANYRF